MLLALRAGRKPTGKQQVSGTTISSRRRGGDRRDERPLVTGTTAPESTPPTDSSLVDLAPGAKVLWVTSNGGHLTELALLANTLKASLESMWVTFDTPQSSLFLRGRRHHFVDYVGPRDLRAAVRAARSVAPLLRRERFDLCVSTGAAVAATVLPMAALAGVPTYYVESLARGEGPSLTGRLLERAPKVRTLTQYPEWASTRWPCTPSTLGCWSARQGRSRPRPLRLLVTLGTMQGYRFDRAVDAVLRVLRPGDQVTWQLGCTTRSGLPGEVLGEVCQSELNALAEQADVVVAHAGVGSVLQQLELGKSPVLVVREAAHGEHVDDHQRQFARSTAGRGLTSVLDLGTPRREVLEAAASRSVHRSDVLVPLAVAA